jgi:hypothetical protein
MKMKYVLKKILKYFEYRPFSSITFIAVCISYTELSHFLILCHSRSLCPWHTHAHTHKYCFLLFMTKFLRFSSHSCTQYFTHSLNSSLTTGCSTHRSVTPNVLFVLHTHVAVFLFFGSVFIEHCKEFRCRTSGSCRMAFQPWKDRVCSPKRWYLITDLHSFVTQNTSIDILSTMRTSNFILQSVTM